jgi:hypothetical protein
LGASLASGVVALPVADRGAAAVSACARDPESSTFWMMTHPRSATTTSSIDTTVSNPRCPLNHDETSPFFMRTSLFADGDEENDEQNHERQHGDRYIETRDQSNRRRVRHGFTVEYDRLGTLRW